MTLLVLAACQPVTDGKPAGDSGSSEETGTGDTETGSDSHTDSGETDSTTDTHESTDSGGDSGLEGVRLGSSADIVLLPETEDDRLGAVVVGDFDDDGAPDIVANAPGGGTYGARPGDGMVYLATNLTPGFIDIGSDTDAIIGTGESYYLGDVAALDANADGVADMALYEAGDDYGAVGRVAVLIGPFGNRTSISTAALSYRGTEWDDGFGLGDVEAGDLDADGLPDLAIPMKALHLGGTDYGGGALGVYAASTTGEYSSDSAIAWVGAAGRTADTYLGFSVSVQDQDGDGIDDLLSSAPGISTVYVFAGPLLGAYDEAAAAAVLEEPNVRGVGALLTADADGDGYLDLVVGSDADDTNGQFSGVAWRIPGPLSGAGSISEQAVWTIHGSGSYEFVGSGMSVGDLDGDGRAEALTPRVDPEEHGETYAWDGNRTGAFSVVEGVLVLRGDDPGDDVIGDALADLDQDGVSDLIAVGSTLRSYGERLVFLTGGL